LAGDCGAGSRSAQLTPTSTWLNFRGSGCHRLARADRQRLGVVVDHWRIAGDLHDHVIQRLFATGLSLQSIAATVNDEIIEQRLTRTVDELDETIQQIRSTIFGLRENSSGSLRGAVLAVVDQLAPVLPVRPDIQLVGPLDTVVDHAIVGDVEAVLRESLTNVAKHAQASKIRVRIQADGQHLAITVTDMESDWVTAPDTAAWQICTVVLSVMVATSVSVMLRKGVCVCNGRSRFRSDEPQADPGLHP
jgi:signal transduction histidine kinase